ncbi:hypothetical protein ACCC84_22820 [Serratia odorifera]|uniref:hypothetical protein n=1 Tax=Serratia odorifera TaxID=618 RepID=UPI003531CEC2
MCYEYQNKKAPLASQEEDFEEINDDDTGMNYEPFFFTQASGSGVEPNLNGLQQRLLTGYKADKFVELQEFRKHGYNIDELRVDKVLLEDFIEELKGIPEFSDWSITSTANALMGMIENVEKMDVKALNGEQKKVMRRTIDLSRQATDVVMMAALHLPLGYALLAAWEDRVALRDDAPTEEDIAEVTANLKATRGAIKQARLAALELDLRIPDKEMPWPTFKEDVYRLYTRLNLLGEGKVKMVKKKLTPDKSFTEKVQTIPPRAVDMAKAVGSGTVKGLKKLPTNKQEWQGTIRQVGKLSKRAGTSLWNKGKTVRPSLNSLTARMGWAVKNTKSQTLYGTQEKFLQASDEAAEFRESLKLLVEQIHFAMSAYLKHAQALAATSQEEVEQRVALRQQRQAAIDRVELLERMLEEKEASVLKEMYSGQAEKIVPFLEGMKKEMDVFWQAAAQLDSLLENLLSPMPEEEEPIFPENKHGELIEALGKVTNAQNRLKQRVMKATLKPFDEFSVDWRIARDIGRYFYARREVLLENNTPASMAQFDAAVEEVIWTQVAGDFRKTRSPRGKQMAVRATWAYREAIAGTLQRSKTVQEIVDEQDNVDTQLIKLGQKSLVGRTVFAGVSGNVGRLFVTKPRNVLLPNLGVVKVLLSPISFWNDYRKLSRAVEPGDAFSWGSYRKMAQRNAFRQAFRMLKFALPRVATTGISGVLALWALYRAGIGDTFKKALTEGITVMPIAGGLGGANKLAGAALGRESNKSDIVMASDNGEIVQEGVGKNNIADFSGMDAHTTQYDSDENKPKNRGKRFANLANKRKGELERLRKIANRRNNSQRSNSSLSSNVTPPSRYVTLDKKTSDEPYINLSESEKKITYLHAVNDTLNKIGSDNSIPLHARQNAHKAKIGMPVVTPVDIDGFKLANTFFIPDTLGSKKGLLVNLNAEKKSYIYIDKPGDIPMSLASNFNNNNIKVFAGLGVGFESTYLDGSGILWEATKSTGKNFKDKFNKVNNKSMNIYDLSENLADSAKEKYVNQPNINHNKYVVEKAISGSKLPTPDISASPTSYSMRYKWASLRVSQYLRSVANPFSTLGGQVQLVVSSINNNSIQDTDEKIKKAEYIGSWVDSTVGTFVSFSPAGIVLNVGQSVAGITADLVENKTPDPLDTAGLVMSCFPGGKIAARVGKFSKVGEKGVKYFLRIGEKTLDLAELGRSIKTAVDTGEPLAIYQAFLASGMSLKDAYDTTKNMSSELKLGEMASLEKLEAIHNNTPESSLSSTMQARTFRVGSTEIGDGMNMELRTHGNIEGASVSEPIIETSAHHDLTADERDLSKNTLEKIRGYTGSEFNEYIKKPNENCANAAVKMSEALRHLDYTDVKVVELGIWIYAARDGAPTNHYVVMAKKDGIDIVVDLTAGQFSKYGLNGPIVTTKNDWTYQWQQAMADYPRVLVKISPLNGGVSTSPFSSNSPYIDAKKTVPGGVLLQSTDWYKKPHLAPVSEHVQPSSASTSSIAREGNAHQPHTNSIQIGDMSKVNLIFRRPSNTETTEPVTEEQQPAPKPVQYSYRTQAGQSYYDVMRNYKDQNCYADTQKFYLLNKHNIPKNMTDAENQPLPEGTIFEIPPLLPQPKTAEDDYE